MFMERERWLEEQKERKNQLYSVSLNKLIFGNSMTLLELQDLYSSK